MTNTIQTHRETALESPYSRDREEAIEELVRVFPDLSSEEKRRTLETLRTISHEATGTQERTLAQSSLVDVFEADPEIAAPLVVTCFCELAETAKHSDERLNAIDSLRELYPEVSEEDQEQIGQQLAEIAGNATYEDERQRARQRLSDVTAENQQTAVDDDSDDGGAAGYLGQSLAEHLANAVEESPEACLQRAEELRDFVAEHPLDDGSYEEVQDDLDDLVRQLDVAPTDGGIDPERKDRVERLATRVERLYGRSG